MIPRDRLLEWLALKELPRAGWVQRGVRDPEDVAAHSWGVAALCLALCPPELNREKVLAIAILHDLPEVRVGDLTPRDAVPRDEKARREAEAAAALLSPELLALWAEYGVSPEGRFVKAVDKLDMALQALRYQRDQGLDPEEFLASLPPEYASLLQG